MKRLLLAVFVLVVALLTFVSPAYAGGGHDHDCSDNWKCYKTTTTTSPEETSTTTVPEKSTTTSTEETTTSTEATTTTAEVTTTTAEVTTTTSLPHGLLGTSSTTAPVATTTPDTTPHQGTLPFTGGTGPWPGIGLVALISGGVLAAVRKRQVT